MPMVTQLGVARQCTLCLRIVQEAIEEAAVTDDETAKDLHTRAVRYASEITLWRQHAHRRRWYVVERHASTMEAMAEQWLLVFA